ncbi:shikimate dehydrogenase [Lactiplantibacillus plantarum]|uniref:shikimate dehydrogenase n=1 Tax=Lactiplantibacillus plantarum TaxID=1590 RepID=UPI00217DF87F|nr:shikimate dehydrogenase [Lactiplantibacillus plantarum]MCS6155353.1 shikimate dehydrogenase [Lactiplantibacillus plantarum]
MEARIDGHTTMLGLFGSPVGHSGSPAMYNYSFEKAGINDAYLAFDIQADEMASALTKMRVLNMRGANVTMPCKKVAAELVDELSPAAELIGAATAIAVQMALDGAQAIHIFNPKDSFYQNAELTAQKIMDKVPACKVTVGDINDQEALTQAIAQSDILANATKAGMAPNVEQTNIKDITVFRSDLVVTDTVYNPATTKMLADAAEHGSKTIGGKGMLVWQGAAAFKLYTGQEMPVEEVTQRFFSDDGGR